MENDLFIKEVEELSKEATKMENSLNYFTTQILVLFSMKAVSVETGGELKDFENFVKQELKKFELSFTDKLLKSFKKIGDIALKVASYKGGDDDNK